MIEEPVQKQIGRGEMAAELLASQRIKQGKGCPSDLIRRGYRVLAVKAVNRNGADRRIMEFQTITGS